MHVHVVASHAMSCRIMSHHITSYYITSCHALDNEFYDVSAVEFEAQSLEGLLIIRVEGMHACAACA